MTSITELRQEISTNNLRDPNYKIRPQTIVDSAINTAYIQVQQDTLGMLPNQETTTTISVVAGTASYNLPSDFLKLYKARYEWKALELIRYEEIDNTTYTGSPEYYYIRANKIWFYPIPDKALSIELIYTKRLSTLSDSQDSEIPARANRLLVLWASIILLKTVNKVQEAQVYEIEYQQILNRAIASLIQAQDLVFN